MEEPGNTDLSTHQTNEILEPRVVGNKISYSKEKLRIQALAFSFPTLFHCASLPQRSILLWLGISSPCQP